MIKMNVRIIYPRFAPAFWVRKRTQRFFRNTEYIHRNGVYTHEESIHTFFVRKHTVDILTESLDELTEITIRRYIKFVFGPIKVGINIFNPAKIENREILISNSIRI